MSKTSKNFRLRGSCFQQFDAVWLWTLDSDCCYNLQFPSALSTCLLCWSSSSFHRKLFPMFLCLCFLSLWLVTVCVCVGVVVVVVAVAVAVHGACVMLLTKSKFRLQPSSGLLLNLFWLLLSWPCQVPILFKKQSVAAMVEVRFIDLSQPARPKAYFFGKIRQNVPMRKHGDAWRSVNRPSTSKLHLPGITGPSLPVTGRLVSGRPWLG